MQLLILADDLTGACDAAAPFAGRRWPVPVLIEGSRSVVAHEMVSAIDLNVRDSQPSVALAAAREATRRMYGRRVFLKVDSTGRGPIWSLIDGALSGMALRAAVLAPAYPRQGVTVHDGRIVIAGATGLGALDLARLVEGSDAETVPPRVIPARLVRQGAAALAASIEDAINQGATRLVVDADGESCLEATAEAWLGAQHLLLAGSAGICAHLAHLIYGSSDQRSRSYPTRSAARGPIVVVVGSPHPMSYEQVTVLRASGSASLVVRSQDDAARLPEGGEERQIVLFTVPPRELGSSRDGGQLSEAVARAAVGFIRKAPPIRGVILVGGATARSFADQMGIDAIEIHGELAPGFAFGVAHGPDIAPILIATKAGRFGTPDALSRAVDYLAKGEP